MSIELLWIIPIISAALLGLILVFNLQKESKNVEVNGDKRNLQQEVNDFNCGRRTDDSLPAVSSNNKLYDVETTVHLVSNALSNQQRIIEKVQGHDTVQAHELNKLKKRLDDLQNEYHAMVKENILLKKRIKRMEHEYRDSFTRGYPPADMKTDESMMEDLKATRKIVNIKQFEETNILALDRFSEVDDTSEINMSEMR